MKEIKILIEKNSPRLEFVLNFLEERLGITIHCLQSIDGQIDDDRCIDYRFNPLENCLSIYNSGFFNEVNELNLARPRVRKGDIIELFPSDETTYDIHFDLFASTFFCLSRYEEYQAFTPDQHGRFPSEASHARRNDYLNRPVVDEWVMLLRDKIEKKWNIDLLQPKPFQISPTIDVDVAWAYLQRKPLHAIGSQFKKTIKGQQAVLQEQRQAYKSGKDPFDTFSMLKEKLQGFNSHYFFLCYHSPPFDTAYFLDNIEFEKLIRDQESFATVGVHPSYASTGDVVKIKQEKQWLEQRIGRSISTSRQHYLKLSIPQTYNDLITLDIQHDFSMGYADQCGFRAGTSLPFYFYDLLAEEKTDLLIHPFSVMDVTLKEYQKYTITQAIQIIREIKQTLKKVNGHFSFIWHNSSFATLGGWDEWERVFDALIE